MTFKNICLLAILISFSFQDNTIFLEESSDQNGASVDNWGNGNINRSDGARGGGLFRANITQRDGPGDYGINFVDIEKHSHHNGGSIINNGYRNRNRARGSGKDPNTRARVFQRSRYGGENLFVLENNSNGNGGNIVSNGSYNRNDSGPGGKGSDVSVNITQD